MVHITEQSKKQKDTKILRNNASQGRWWLVLHWILKRNNKHWSKAPTALFTFCKNIRQMK